MTKYLSTPHSAQTELAEFFNTAMMTAGVTATKAPPVVAVQMNREKGFAFLEFRTAEEATAAMAFDGITLQGSALKVRRPKDYGGGSLLAPLAYSFSFILRSLAMELFLSTSISVL